MNEHTRWYYKRSALISCQLNVLNRSGYDLEERGKDEYFHGGLSLKIQISLKIKTRMLLMISFDIFSLHNTHYSTNDLPFYDQIKEIL